MKIYLSRMNELLRKRSIGGWVLLVLSFFWTMPGVAVILAATIALEIGEVQRFPSAMHLASYAGTTPLVHASGGKVRYGPLRNDVNGYLKWAFAEAAKSVAVNHTRCPDRHVSHLYRRLRQKKGHANDWSRGTASGRSRLPRAAAKTNVSGSSSWSRLYQPGVSAMSS